MAEKKDRWGAFLFKILGPATVEGAIQGWSPEANAQWKRLRENARRAADQPAASPAEWDAATPN